MAPHHPNDDAAKNALRYEPVHIALRSKQVLGLLGFVMRLMGTDFLDESTPHGDRRYRSVSVGNQSDGFPIAYNNPKGEASFEGQPDRLPPIYYPDMGNAPPGSAGIA